MHGTLSLIFMIKVMVLYFVGDTHKLMTIHVLVVLVFVFTASYRKEILGRLLFANLHPLAVADEVSGQSCHLVTAIHDDGDDGLILCEWHS